jgi:very-short-patch-repair endonuclease
MELEPPNETFKQRARELRKNSTLSEVLLWNQLKNKQLGIDFNRQIVINNRYIADFCARKHNIIVEIDGSSHGDKLEYDIERHNYLTNLGFTVIHVYDLDVKRHMADVLLFIQTAIEQKIPFCVSEANPQT